MNGFQTQPGESAEWALANGGLLLHDRDGGLVVDPHWPDEYILDPGSAASRLAIFDRVAPVIRGCAAKGFDAIDLDNLDTAGRFTDAATGRIDPGGVLQLARMYVREAHELGLAVGQKNAAQLAATGRSDLGFDFAIAESCAVYDECAAFRAGYGEHVLQVEYTDALPAGFDAVCDSADRAPLTILRDRPSVPRRRRLRLRAVPRRGLSRLSRGVFPPRRHWAADRGAAASGSRSAARWLQRGWGSAGRSAGRAGAHPC
ncbi:endo alpha-1,4 polygalactosaminidase [Microterricola viridarii]|uniref:endo alpha-1,4 polygalactosaminidase n=1 Tax=Microterricola viridarii TaxID=412690 RepID=UPI002FF541C0